MIYGFYKNNLLILLILIIISSCIIFILLFSTKYLINNKNQNNNINSDNCINNDIANNISNNDISNNDINNNITDDIIVTTSTTPKRLNNIDKIIDNILNKQTIKPTKLYLNVPYKFKRTKEIYSEVLLLNLQKKYDRLQINRCEDIGPITKVSETLKLINNNNIIIIIDDDIDYPENFIENLVNKINKNDDCVVANSIYPKIINGIDIDIVEGYKGICFKRNIFEKDFFDIINNSNSFKHCFNSDDYIISRYLSNKKIKFIKPDLDFEHKLIEYSFKDDPLWKQDNIDHENRYKMCKVYLDNKNVLFKTNF